MAIYKIVQRDSRGKVRKTRIYQSKEAFDKWLTYLMNDGVYQKVYTTDTYVFENDSWKSLNDTDKK